MHEGQIAFQVEHAGHRGTVELQFGEWTGSSIDIQFLDRLYDNSGTIRLHGPTARARIVTQRRYGAPLEEPEAQDAYFASIIQLFSNAYTFGWSPEAERMVTYDADYHNGNNYTDGNEREIAIKQVQAGIVRKLAGPGKVLVGGCSNGELVRQCRNQGLDAWGFDVIPNLGEIAFPEVQEHVRAGSLTGIPFGAEDGFDTLVAIDVMEHIPERDLPTVVSEWTRLGVARLVLLINLNQFWFPGHITLRPLSWWEDQFAPAFSLSRVESRFDDLPAVYSNSGHYNQQWTLWERQR